MIHPLFLTFLGVTCAQVIPNTYVHPEFRQSRASIESNIQEVYTAFTASYNGGGWSAQNAWTSVAQWDAQRGKRDFYNQVKKAQDYLATNPGGGYEVWKVALVNYYNDDIGWAGLSNVQAYEAYGDEDFLTRARGAYDVGYPHDLADVVYSRTRPAHTRRVEPRLAGGDQECGQQDCQHLQRQEHAWGCL